MAAPSWEQQPVYVSEARQIKGRAKSSKANAIIKYRLDLKTATSWAANKTKEAAAGAEFAFDVSQTDADVTYRVVARDKEEDEEVPSEDIVVPKNAAAGTPPAQDGPRYFHKGYAAVVGLIIVTLMAPAAGLLRWGASKLPSDEPNDSAIVVAGVIALGLLGVGLAIAAAGVFLLAVEHRATMTERPRERTREPVAQIPAIVTEYAKLKAPWAVMAAAIAALVSSAWVGVHIADTGKPTTTTTTTTPASSASTPTSRGGGVPSSSGSSIARTVPPSSAP